MSAMRHTMLGALPGAAALLAGTLALATGAAEVYVNGNKLSPAGIAWLAEYSCGPVPPGEYWLDLETGYWGYAGSAQVMGHVRERCTMPRRPSLSERGQLYLPDGILEGGSDSGGGSEGGSVGNDPIEGSDWDGPRQPAE